MLICSKFELQSSFQRPSTFAMSKSENTSAKSSCIEDLPPAYSESSNAAGTASRPITRTVPGLPTVPFTSYTPKDCILSKDSSTISLSDVTLCSSTQDLQRWIVSQISLPPIPEIRIKGSHGWGGGTEIDFDIRLNMLRYIITPDHHQALVPKHVFTSIANKPKTSITPSSTEISRLATQFVQNTSSQKSLQITRTLSNWDTDLLIGRLHAHILSLKYKGTISITFPVSMARTVLKADTSFASSIRNTLFGGSEGNKIEIETVWPYANRAGGENEGGYTTERMCLVRSEEGWWRDWKAVVSQAIVDRRRGWIGLDDMIEYTSRPVREISVSKPWGEA